MTEKLTERFWKGVDVRTEDECWPWTKSKVTNGYGRSYPYMAHRLSYMINCGPIPEGLCVLHHCDNPACCNPRHLFLGTRKDNTQDMIRKRRENKGPRNKWGQYTMRRGVSK